MIYILDLSQSPEWDRLVQSFSNYDVYYLSGYVKAFHIHGDGDPFLMYYTSPDLRAMYVYMRRPTSLDGVYDAISPYGYGGVLFEGHASEKNLQMFWTEYLDTMRREAIVDNFVRYHPVLGNAEQMRRVSSVIDLGKTIAIDLSSEKIISENLTSKNRGKIRKAQKNGIEIRHGKDPELFEKFKEIYRMTMDNDGASPYYYFRDAFYQSIYQDLDQNFEMFYAVYKDKIIAMAIMLFANGKMHYHLSGSMIEYRSLAPTNLLLYEASLWGMAQGFKTLHLGGGLGAADDSLYKFKEGFNRYNNFVFSIGQEIFDEARYVALIELRKASDSNYNETSHFFPLYRA